MLCGENALCHVLNEYMTHYHAERPHQGQGRVILVAHPGQQPEGPMQCQERLSGLLEYYPYKAT